MKRKKRMAIRATDKCSFENCKMEETGKCALHDIEVVKRENVESWVKSIPKIAGIFLFIIAGSFAHSQYGHYRIDETQKIVNEVAKNNAILQERVKSLVTLFEKEHKEKHQEEEMRKLHQGEKKNEKSIYGL